MAAVLANVADAKPPLECPRWLGRLLARESVMARMTSASIFGEEVRNELVWEPRHATWREG
jgi:hypothetical protein